MRVRPRCRKFIMPCKKKLSEHLENVSSNKGLQNLSELREEVNTTVGFFDDNDFVIRYHLTEKQFHRNSKEKWLKERTWICSSILAQIMQRSPTLILERLTPQPPPNSEEGHE